MSNQSWARCRCLHLTDDVINNVCGDINDGNSADEQLKSDPTVPNSSEEDGNPNLNEECSEHVSMLTESLADQDKTITQMKLDLEKYKNADEAMDFESQK